MTTSLTEILRKNWLQLAGQYSTDKALVDRQFDEIADRYSEPQRRYHTLEHLRDVFSDLAEPVKVVDQANRHGVLFAAWFHDIVYQPGKNDNEDRSADLATKALTSLGVQSDVVQIATHAILCTKEHADSDNDYATELFLDADMAILGKPKSVYRTYAEKVREEFRHIPTLAYTQGRKRFLRSALDRPRIFFTDHFHGLYEERARQNMSAELQAL